MARQKTLKPLADYLKPLRRKPRRVEGDGSEAVAAMLDRKIDKQARRSKNQTPDEDSTE